MNSSLLSERSEFSHSTCTTDACNCNVEPIFNTQQVYGLKSDNSISWNTALKQSFSASESLLFVEVADNPSFWYICINCFFCLELMEWSSIFSLDATFYYHFVVFFLSQRRNFSGDVISLTTCLKPFGVIF